MNLPETIMETPNQLAFMVNVAHNEWIEEELAGVAEGNFDTWLPFIGQLALQLANVKQRTES